MLNTRNIFFFSCGSTAQFWALAASMKLFTSVTSSRTVSRTPWTGDHLVARPLLTAPGDCEDGEVGGMNGIGRGNRSTRRKPAPTPHFLPQIREAKSGRRGGKPATNRFSYGAANKVRYFSKEWVSPVFHDRLLHRTLADI
jgi:hypothetical protein